MSIDLRVPGYNEFGHYDKHATVGDVVAWLLEHGAYEGTAIETSPISGHVPVRNLGRYLVYRIEDSGV